MIDLHTHILPDIDDGAQSWEEALEMAQMAADAGTEILAATCHANLPGDRSRDFCCYYRKELDKFRQLLKLEGIPVKVLEGMEIFAGENIFSDLEEGRLLTLNRSRYVLVEFALDTPASYIYHILDRMLERQYVPVIAHPERYRCVQQTPVHVYEWYYMGTVIQINKGSVFGRFGQRAEQTVHSLLRHCLVDIAVSDAHSPVRRTTDMSNLYEQLAIVYGSGCPKLLLKENPRRILENKRILRENPIPYF